MQNNDDRVIRIEDKIDKIVDKIASIDVTLAAQHESLKDHIRRTELLEQEVKPIQKHVAMIQGGLKLVGICAVLASIGEGVVQVLSFLHK